MIVYRRAIFANIQSITAIMQIHAASLIIFLHKNSVPCPGASLSTERIHNWRSKDSKERIELGIMQTLAVALLIQDTLLPS